MKNKNLIITIFLLVLVGGGAFFAGMKYQQKETSRNFSQRMGNFQGQVGQRQTDQQRNGFRPVNGEIISADEKSITVKLDDGGSKIVFLGEKTVINKSSEGSKEDLKVGEKVAAFGTENSDGSVTAQNIQLNPVFKNVDGQSPQQPPQQPPAQ